MIAWVRSAEVTDADSWILDVGDIRLRVRETGRWVWRWTVLKNQVKLAEGLSVVDRREYASWDYHGVEKAQARCLAVASGILLQRVREAWSDDSISVGLWPLDESGEKFAAANRGDFKCPHNTGGMVWSVDGCNCTVDSQGETMTEALIAALKAAP